MEKLVLIDGNSIMNRAFYALPLLTNSKGEFCNALYGFANIIIKIITEQKPKYMAVAFDLKNPTFRHKLYSEYKGKRRPTPPELLEQLENAKPLLETMGIKVLQKPGYEADDIIGTMSKRFDIQTIIVSGDKDLFQLIDKNVTVWHTKKGISDILELNEQGLFDLMQVSPKQIIELKSLMGDASDNIPGVAGIGPKTATELLANYGTLENIYDNIDKLKKSVAEKLVKDRDNAFLSKTLATINVESPIDCTLEECEISFPFSSKVLEQFKRFEFKSIIKRENLFEEDVKIVATKNVQLKMIEDENQLKNLLEEILKVDLMCFNISDEQVNISISKYQEYVVKFNDNLTKNYVFEQLKQVFENNNIKKIVYNYKKMLHILYDYNIKLNGVIFDCSVAKYLISGGKKPTDDFAEVALDNNYPEFAHSSCMFDFKQFLLDQLKQEEMLNLYQNVEYPLIEILFQMEIDGFKIDTKILEELGEEYKKELVELERNIQDLADEKFNINSPKQLASILFDKLQLPSPKKQSTSVEVLEEIEDLDPIVPLILRYRKIFKIQSTYIESFKKLTDKNNLIHTQFHQTLTTTGRLSSTEPNLQNIPIRDSEGKNLRKLFVSRFKDGFILSADYSQIELRLMAHYSKDENLLHAYNNGIDIHSKTASDIFETPLNEVTDFMRRQAKAVNFGIMYGISDFGLAKNLKISRKEAKQYIETYLQKYQSVKNMMEEIIESAKQNGYATSLLGRRRKVDEINSSNYNLRQFGERIAMNMPFQGSSADIIKLAMINVNNAMKNKNLESKLILQIHDELIVDCKKEELEIVKQILKYEMENVVKLNVPLVVDVEFGESLFDAK